jgi:hypothetical protein
LHLVPSPSTFWYSRWKKTKNLLLGYLLLNV